MFPPTFQEMKVVMRSLLRPVSPSKHKSSKEPSGIEFGLELMEGKKGARGGGGQGRFSEPEKDGRGGLLGTGAPRGPATPPGTAPPHPQAPRASRWHRPLLPPRGQMSLGLSDHGWVGGGSDLPGGPPAVKIQAQTLNLVFALRFVQEGSVHRASQSAVSSSLWSLGHRKASTAPALTR